MPVALPAVVVAAVFLGWLTVENLRSLRLRDPLTYGGAFAVTGVLAISALAAGEMVALARGIAGGAGLYALLFVAVLIWPAGLGYGTVKASVIPGVAAGALGGGPWLAAAVALPLALVLTAVFAWLRHVKTVPSAPMLVAALAAACVAAAVG